MNLRDIIRSVIREEQAPESKPAQSEALTAPASPDRQASLARANKLTENLAAIAARKSEVLDDERRIAELEAELDEIRLRVGNHRAQLWAESLATSCAIDRELNLLRDCCSPQLVDFVALMDVEHARLRSLEPSESFGLGEKSILSDNPRTPRLIFSNAPAISRRLRAVMAARSRAEELKLLDRTEDEIRAELAGLHQALPAIDNCEELVDRI